ncbi:MAG: hypothetical protein QMC83_01650 [Thermodesulfovibrionales bacterium]|nr:hypothetical protein [Thermodesulfovibrionales bacterium]
MLKHYDETYINKIAEDLEIDEAILKFLIHMSIQPSLDAHVNKLKDLVDLNVAQGILSNLWLPSTDLRVEGRGPG